jgi:hypothetical protein
MGSLPIFLRQNHGVQVLDIGTLNETTEIQPLPLASGTPITPIG